MTTFIIIFLAALALTGAGTPAVRRLAIRTGFVDAPASRKLHQDPMPLMGGLAILAGAVVAFLLVFLQASITTEVIAILVALILVAVLGLIDDRMGMWARYKLGGQALGVLILLWGGVFVRLPFTPVWLDYIITFLWVMGLSNALNFLDNMDGLTAGVSAVASAFIVLMAASNGQQLVTALGAAVLGACLGFLRHNFKPAKIFMGDAGSLFLGFVLAILTLELSFPQNSNFVTWMVPILILGVPLFDTTLVVIARTRRGVNPFTTAGKDHTSHRLVELGYTQREAVLLLYLAGGAFGMVALFVVRATIWEGYLIGATVAFMALYAIWRLERWRDKHIGKEDRGGR